MELLLVIHFVFVFACLFVCRVISIQNEISTRIRSTTSTIITNQMELNSNFCLP
jgi:hypothetical protein